MLQRLTVKNFAIIEDVNITFKSGLTVLTGETGAGKSYKNMPNKKTTFMWPYNVVNQVSAFLDRFVPPTRGAPWSYAEHHSQFTL